MDWRVFPRRSCIVDVPSAFLLYGRVLRWHACSYMSAHAAQNCWVYSSLDFWCFDPENQVCLFQPVPFTVLRGVATASGFFLSPTSAFNSPSACFLARSTCRHARNGMFVYSSVPFIELLPKAPMYVTNRLNDKFVSDCITDGTRYSIDASGCSMSTHSSRPTARTRIQDQVNVCVCVHIYTYTHIHTHIYIVDLLIIRRSLIIRASSSYTVTSSNLRSSNFKQSNFLDSYTSHHNARHGSTWRQGSKTMNSHGLGAMNKPLND